MYRIAFEWIREEEDASWDRLMMLIIAGSNKWEYCFNFKRDVGIGSKSQLVSRDWKSSLETSSVVKQVKYEKLGGVIGGKMWGE